MKDIFIQVGVNPEGLCSIVRLFNFSNICDLFIINDNDDLEDEFETIIWSDLKLKKTYSLAPQLPDTPKVFDTITLKKVINIFNISIVDSLMRNDCLIHLTFNQKPNTINLKIISEIIHFRIESHPGKPTIIYLLNNFSSQQFKEVFTSYDSRNKVLFETPNVFIIECVTDILSSLPAHRHEDCIFNSEEKRGKIYFRKFDINQINDDVLKNHINLIITSSISAVESDLSKLKRQFFLCDILRFLVAIYTADVRDNYMYDYIMLRPQSSSVLKGLVAELTGLVLLDKQVRPTLRQLSSIPFYMHRVVAFGGYMEYALPYSKAGLKDLYDVLSGFLTPLIEALGPNKIKLNYMYVPLQYIPYALERLKWQIEIHD